MTVGLVHGLSISSPSVERAIQVLALPEGGCTGSS